MSCFRGIVPKYLVMYSLVKVMVDLYDFKTGFFNGLESKFYYLEVAKFLVIIFRILGTKYIRQRVQFHLTILSILLETIIFYFQNKHFSRLRLYLEFLFGAISLVFLIFFHPSYCEEPKPNKKTRKVVGKDR